MEARDKVPSLFAEYSFSLCAGRLSRLWQTSSSVSHRWPVTHSVCSSPEKQKSSQTLAKHVPLSHAGCVFLSDCASPRACLLLCPWVTDVANSQSSARMNSPVARTQPRSVRRSAKCTPQFCCWRRTNHGRIVFHYCKSDR